jgi:hypothetical protein
MKNMKTNNDLITKQNEICMKYGATFFPPKPNQKVGISLDTLEHKYPLNGLRHHPEGDSTGWFIWVGTGPINKDFNYFQPLHVVHLLEKCPEVVAYLGLPPGWRILIAPNYVDVWFDQNIFDSK